MSLIRKAVFPVGGLGTPVGTPPNLIGLGAVRELLGVQISFTQWMTLGLPLVIVQMSFLLWWLRPAGNRESSASGSAAHAELAKPLAGHLDVDAVWSFSSTDLSAQVESESAGNVKRTWVNHARARDWLGAEGEGRLFLRHATAVKTVWVPYGE